MGNVRRGIRMGSAMLLLVSSVSHAQLPPAQKCQAGKNQEAGKYLACRHKAEAKLLTTAGHCSLTPSATCYADSACDVGETCIKDTAKFEAALTKCEDKLTSKWQSLEQKAAGACPDGLLVETLKSALDESASHIAGGLAGDGLTTCSDAVVPKPVLMVVANDGFYYQEYAHPRAMLEAGGFEVTVAAGLASTAVPHANTGQPWGIDGSLTPDLTLADVDSSQYQALVFVGGWGASSYQYAFTGTIDNPAWQADPMIAARANELIGEFLAANKYVMGVCHGVSVLAWARVGGVSPVSGKNVVASDIGSPAQTYNGVHYNNYELSSAQMVADNGALVAPPNSIGNPSTPADDVVVDGRIVTVQNQHGALAGGLTLVELLKAQLAE